MNEEVILKKVVKREKRITFVKRCVKVKVCPDCGSELRSSTADIYNTIEYECTSDSCSFST